MVSSGGLGYDAGVYTYINYPDAQTTLPLGINNSGEIVGGYTGGGGGHGFIDTGGTFLTLDYPGAQSPN